MDVHKWLLGAKAVSLAARAGYAIVIASDC
jgi:hypothetical protein